jgi:citrate lyase beta subunit
MMLTNFLQLGASLYVPANRADLLPLANQVKYPALRSIIICFEDSLHEADVERAFENLSAMLLELVETPMLRFIRVRNANMLRRLSELANIDKMDGFVIPKANRDSLTAYFDSIPADSHFALMPILETKEVFDGSEMQQLRRWLDDHPMRDRICGLRIGGNDLLNLLHLRRRKQQTIYDTPVATVIQSLIQIFRPAGYALSAPVFDGLNRADVLAKEVERDIDFGLLTKSAIHPAQVSAIEAQYSVSKRDSEVASSILSSDAPAVFGMDGTMCETSTHSNWARMILARRQLYGVREAQFQRSAIARSLP